MRRSIAILSLIAGAAWAHVGSPDVFHEGDAGPYPLFVTIRPPAVIPGVAEIEIRMRAKDVREIRIVPTPLTGPGAQFPPTADVAERSKLDPQFFTGALWIMVTGSWQVRVTVEGDRGRGELSVPVPAVATRTATMQAAVGAGLSVLMLVLAFGAVSIVGAGVREGQLEPGLEPTPDRRRRARIAMGAAAVVVAAALWLGNDWWIAEANNYSRFIYRPLQLTPSLEAGGKLSLRLSDPGWAVRRSFDDFIPDHNHLMHLFLIRLPEMERVWHLHPDMPEAGLFMHALPAIPAGRYQIFADVIHRSGFPETMMAEVDLPDVAGRPLTGDDAAGAGPGLSTADKSRSTAELSGGYRMIWKREPGPVPVKQPQRFTFRVETKDGRPAADLELYMGMQGHAAFVKTDRTVFAHVHPSGSVPMAALELGQKLIGSPADPHAGHHQSTLPPEVSFPYGIPQPGEYRVYVQIKRAGKVETGVFDLRAE